MKLGISIELYKMDELEPKLKAAADCGYKYCQMFLREVEASEHVALEVAGACEAFGIVMGPLGVYANPLRPKDAPMGYDMKKVKRTIELLPILKTNEVIMWSGTYSQQLLQYSDGNHGAGARRELARCTEEILALLDPVSGTLIFEPFYTHVLHDEESIISFLASMKTDRVKVIMDPPNHIRPDEYDNRDRRLVELVDRLHDHIGAVHFKDFRLLPDKSWDYPGPGGGVMNYPLLVRKLREYNYQSWGIIEHVGVSEYSSAKKFLEMNLVQVK